MKRILREKYAALRAGISGDKRRAASRSVAEKVLSDSGVAAAENIMIYVSCGSEIPTDTLINGLLEAGKKVYIPVMREGRIKAARLRNAGDLLPGALGIPEVPEKNREYAHPEELDAVILPGLSFSSDGRRLGRGGGHFDRFLSETGACKIGLCYSAQIDENIPEYGHDIRVDKVITED